MALWQRCGECGKSRYCIHGKCRDCTPKEELAEMYNEKREKAKSHKPLSKARKPTGEWEMFTGIWLKRPHVCGGCDCKLYVMIPTVFSHTIRKADDEDLRLEPKNIELECPTCHDIWDKGTWEQIIKQKNFTRRMEYIKEVRPDLYKRKALKILEFTGLQLPE